MGKRLCWKCQKRHGKPTGLKCKRPAPVNEVDLGSQHHDQAGAAMTGGGPKVPDNQDSFDDITVQMPAAQNGVSQLEKRMDSLESMLYKFTENFSPAKGRSDRHGHRHRSVSVSTTSSEERHASSRRKQSKESPSRYRYKYDNIFLEEDATIKCFEQVMVATFHTLSELFEEGEDISGIISHGLFMAEKASANVYVSEAFTGYDKYVRRVAEKKGPAGFGIASELERGRYFNLENHKEVRALKNKSGKGLSNNQRPKPGICRRYNGDNGCFARNCQYSHKCSTCEQVGHPARECKVSLKDKSNK